MERLEELVGALFEKIEEMGNRIETIYEEILDRNHHPAGFCEGPRCSQAMDTHDRAVAEAERKHIFGLLGRGARNLSLEEPADDLAQEFIELEGGNDYGPGF